MLVFESGLDEIGYALHRGFRAKALGRCPRVGIREPRAHELYAFATVDDVNFSALRHHREFVCFADDPAQIDSEFQIDFPLDTFQRRLKNVFDKVPRVALRFVFRVTRVEHTVVHEVSAVADVIRVGVLFGDFTVRSPAQMNQTFFPARVIVIELEPLCAGRRGNFLNVYRGAVVPHDPCAVLILLVEVYELGAAKFYVSGFLDYQAHFISPVIFVSYLIQNELYNSKIQK